MSASSDATRKTKHILFLASESFQFSKSKIRMKGGEKAKHVCIFRVKSEPSLEGVVCSQLLQARSGQAPSGLDHWLRVTQVGELEYQC